MTYHRGINSKYKAKDFLKRGFRSMFPNYEDQKQSTPPVDTDPKQPQPPTSK